MSTNFEFTDLLPELYFEIFDYLDLIDLGNLLMVNKKLNNLIKEYPIKELITNDFKLEFSWSFTSKLWNFNYTISQEKFNSFLNGHLNLRLLKCLKIIAMTIDLELINGLNSLENLEIIYCELNGTELNLSNLKYLEIYGSKICNNNLEINISNLTHLDILKSEESNKLTFNYPLSIKNLESEFNEDMISIFKNVESYVCYSSINENVLQVFSNLKN